MKKSKTKTSTEASSTKPLSLPVEFVVNNHEWQILLNDQFKKSIAGSVIILLLGLFIASYGFGAFYIALIAVIAMLGISFFKKRNELLLLKDHTFVLTQKEISAQNSTGESKIIALNKIKTIFKNSWGLHIKTQPKDTKEDIRIPAAIPHYAQLVQYFEGLGLVQQS